MMGSSLVFKVSSDDVQDIFKFDLFEYFQTIFRRSLIRDRLASQYTEMPDNIWNDLHIDFCTNPLAYFQFEIEWKF